MALPKPKYPLDDSCSILYNNTLYTYNSEAFQSLSLVEGAEWTQLPQGESVTGGVCVKATPANGQDALYIVGGTSSNTTDEYSGLQRYTFDDGKWETITTTVLVAQNRLWHSAVYLNASDSILMYAGSQDGTQHLSSQTFTIAASPPYNVLSFGPADGAVAPSAGIQPLLLPWSSSSAIYIGGTDTNTDVMVFDPATSWANSNSTLASPIYSTSAVKAVVVTGDDGCKNLYTFDMTVAPNVVNRTVLVDGSGNPVQSAEAIVSTSTTKETATKRAKRSSLTEADWPAYNGTLAPTSTRTNYSVAMSADGEVVISGGNEDDVLCIFEAKENAWADATSMLVKSPTQQIIVPSTLSSSASPSVTTSSSIATSTGNSTAASGGSTDDDADPFPLKALAALLGSILGIAFLLVWHRRGDDKGNGSAGSGTSSHFDKNYEAAISHTTPPDQSFAQSALAKEVSFGQETVTPRPRNPGTQRRGSTRRSSGWNRYWSGGSAMTSFLGFGESKRNTSNGDDEATSQYSDPRLPTQANTQRRPSQITTASSLVPPLKIPIPGDTPLYRVATNSPTVSTAGSHFPMAAEMSGKIEGLRPDSYLSNTSSYDDKSDAYSSGVPESVKDPESWAMGHQDPSRNRPSNGYSVSVYTTNRDTAGGDNFSLQVPQPPPPVQQQSQPSIPSDMSWLNLGTKTRI
ncbi:hypothetical protein SS1G_04605 [Sclerotinia sclerotiorum 1980 UF-70]|uniref:Pre-mRNA splicing factor CLF1 n=1 Tax=Sclerotinia sclerotiorum (strain ATCC 18683 / 1980 / Ss-1) TaxID=665079 RepID=A7EH13_SCLS1|nr:hypothetical protein SS1G_04605 [Sclerotinia sclerotiorum 1980 UF-70]EDO02129.1 hypothetical protein SS1G_04605 [Sclerotinia sclerotiorum 1980 UF-70]